MGLNAGGTFVGVASQIAVQPFSIHYPKVSGTYYNSGFGTAAIGVATPESGNICASLFVISKRTSFDRIACTVSNPIALSKIRLGIYSNDEIETKPLALILDSGELSGAGAGDVEATIAITLNAGVYWLAQENNDLTDALTLARHDDNFAVLGADTPASQNAVSWLATFAWAALPATFPACNRSTTSKAFVSLRVV